MILYADVGTANLGDFANSLPVLSGLYKKYGKISLIIQDEMMKFNGIKEFLLAQEMFDIVAFQSEIQSVSGNVFAFNSGYANDLNLSLSLTRNALDQMIFPKQGSNFSLSGQLTPPYSVFNGKDYTKLSISERYKFIEYQKYKITAEWFTMLTHKKAAEGEEARNLVLRMKVGYGFLGYYKNLRYEIIH